MAKAPGKPNMKDSTRVTSSSAVHSLKSTIGARKRSQNTLGVAARVTELSKDLTGLDYVFVYILGRSTRFWGCKYPPNDLYFAIRGTTSLPCKLRATIGLCTIRALFPYLHCQGALVGENRARSTRSLSTSLWDLPTVPLSSGRWRGC